MVTDLDLFHLKSLLRPLTPLIQVGSSGLKPAQPLGSPVSSQSETGPDPDVTVFQSKTRTAYDVTVFQSEAKTSPDVIVSGQVGFWGSLKPMQRMMTSLFSSGLNLAQPLTSVSDQVRFIYIMKPAQP